MPQRMTTLATLVLAFAATGSEAAGQLIRIRPRPDGGTSIRVPFVRVETDGAGGSYVRAPFTETYTPGYGLRPAYPGPLRPVPTRPPTTANQPTPAELAPAPGPRTKSLEDADWQQLRRVLRTSARRLQNELDSDMRSRLQPEKIEALLLEDDNLPPSVEIAEELRSLLDAYHEVSARTPSAADLTADFQMVKSALSEIVEPAMQRQLRLLRGSITNLDASLEEFTNGRDWQRYLRLPISGSPRSSSVLVQDPPAPPSSDRDVLQRSELEASLSRFDQVRDDPRFEVIARLPAFQTTHADLRLLLGLLPDSGAVEELPPPKQDK